MRYQKNTGFYLLWKKLKHKVLAVLPINYNVPAIIVIVPR